MTSDWPFDQPPNVAVITLRSILDGERDILCVSHDADDCGWQFLDGGDAVEAEARVVGLRTIVEIDPTVVEIADMSPGWVAVRSDRSSPWDRIPRACDG